MLDVISTFELIASTNSRKEKEKILYEHISDENFKQVLIYLLNPFYITGISTKKMNKELCMLPTQYFDSFVDLMDYILSHNTGSDEVINNIQYFLYSYSDREKDFYKGIITKSLKIGCDIKTINKVYGKDFIPSWEVQQSERIQNVQLVDGEWFSLSQKLNGVRGTYYNGKIISRQGKPFQGLNHILNDIAKLTEVDELADMIFDGELIRNNVENISDNENFRVGTGILNSDDADKSQICFVIFDFIPVEEFKHGESVLTYRKRLPKIKKLNELIWQLGLKHIRVVPIYYSGTDQTKIEQFLKKMVNEDKEGLMLNRDAKYKCKRHTGILKVKRFYTVDLKVVGYEEGRGRLINTLGALIVEYKNNKINVGAGYTDEERATFWSNRDSLIGRVIEVKYKEESFDKNTGKPSLQFPVFVRLREEGKTPSYY